MRLSARQLGVVVLAANLLGLVSAVHADDVARHRRGGVWRWQQPPAAGAGGARKDVNQADPDAARRLRERARLLDAIQTGAAGAPDGSFSVQAEALAQTGTERILVILVEFAGTDSLTFWPGSHWDPIGSSAVSDIVWGPDGPMIGDCSNIIPDSGVFGYSGPLHNQIERPRGAGETGWNIIWTPDFNPQYYRGVLFGNGFTFDYPRQDGSAVHQAFAGKSLASYYADVSGGKYTIAGEVVGWLQVPHSVWWYGADECPGRLSLYASNYVASDGAIPNAGSAKTLVVDALEAVKAANPNFAWAQYDGNGDGIIDHLWIIFAGLGEEASAALLARTTYGEGTMWSHVGSLDAPYEVVPGIKASRYVMLPENSGVGAFAQHFAYDLGSGSLGSDGLGGGGVGGADLGAAEGGTPSTGFWTPMSNPNVGFPTRFLPQSLDPATPIPDGQSAAIGFGTISQGGSRPIKTFTVRNDGTLPLTLGAVSVPTGFTATEALGGPLAPGASDTFSVRLDNTATGSKKGRVQFVTNDADESPYDFAISGGVTWPTSRTLDFGTASSPVAAGYIGVTPATKYPANLAYGWSSGTIDARDRAKGDDLVRDFDFTPLATFVVNVPNGIYDVTATFGDATGAHEQMGISLEGALVDTVSTAVKEFVVRTYRVTVADSQLTVLLDDLGGADANVVVNALEVK